MRSFTPPRSVQTDNALRFHSYRPLAVDQYEDGFALPITLFVVTLVTIMLTTVFVRVQIDHRIGQSSGDNVDALAVAQSGLHIYLGTANFDACWRAVRPLDGDSIRINVNDGYADVVANVVQKPADTLAAWMYIIRSTGRIIEPTQGSDPQAVRTVAQFAEWHTNTIDVLAAFTAANGLESPASSFNSGELKGNDQAPSGCKDPNVSALRVPNNQDPASLPGFVLNGTLPYVVDAGSGQDLALLTRIDWLSTITGGVEADYDYFKLWDLSFPVMLVDAPSDTVNFGTAYTPATGLLIVTGDLVIEGGAYLQFNGVVLVGGEIEFDAADQRFDGIVISGLNEQLGQNQDRGDQDGNFLDIDYNSYYVRQALQSLAGWAPVENGWVDNWASY